MWVLVAYVGERGISLDAVPIFSLGPELFQFVLCSLEAIFRLGRLSQLGQGPIVANPLDLSSLICSAVCQILR
jgi:hypothetical protein